MSTISHPPAVPERQSWRAQLRIPELWASLSITVMWVVVAVTSIWGPNLVSTSSDGNSTTIPSGIIVALLATIGSWAIAKRAFGRSQTND
jgi:hypothetical protein